MEKVKSKTLACKCVTPTARFPIPPEVGEIMIKRSAGRYPRPG
jgi:hypothetical protein